MVLVLITVCGCVCSCIGGKKSGASPDELLLRLCEMSGGENNKAVLYLNRTPDAENSGFRVMSGEDFGYLYSGKFEAPACMDRIVGYAIRLPLDESGHEIHIIECVDPSDTEEVGALLLARVERMQSAEILEFAPEGYEICFRGAIVRAYGRYVFLLSTPDNASLEAEIKRLIG